MLTILLIISMAWGAPVVVPSPSAPDAEYRAYLVAHPESSTPTQTLMRSIPSAAARDRLVADFAEAQKVFLSGGGESARLSFERLLKKINAEDWSKSEREVFYLSALRRAQLGNNEADQTKWLTLALSVSHGLTPDTKLFPPPLIEQYEKIRQAAPKRVPNIDALGSEWTRVLVNGVSCTANDCPALVDAGVPVRVTYLADKWQPVTVVTNLSRINRENPTRKAWLEGDCKSSKFARASDILGERQSFFNLSCEKKDIAKREINFNPVPAAAGTATALTMFPEPKPRPFYKSPWLWTGVGVAVITAVLIASNKKKDSKEEKEPSTTYGY